MTALLFIKLANDVSDPCCMFVSVLGVRLQNGIGVTLSCYSKERYLICWNPPASCQLSNSIIGLGLLGVGQIRAQSSPFRGLRSLTGVLLRYTFRYHFLNPTVVVTYVSGSIYSRI